jgi:hypothetical protein
MLNKILNKIKKFLFDYPIENCINAELDSNEFDKLRNKYANITHNDLEEGDFYVFCREPITNDLSLYMNAYSLIVAKCKLDDYGYEKIYYEELALFIYNAKDKTRGKIYWDESLYKYINEPFFNDRKYLFYNSYTNFEL